MMAVSLVRVWDGRGDLLAWRGPETERVRVETGRTTRASLTLHRSTPGCPTPLVPPVDEHLAAGPGEASAAWLSCADVIVREAPEADTALTALQPVFPGCLVMAVASRSGACALAVAGWRFALLPLGREAAAPDEVASYASALHAWVASGRPVGALGAASLTLTRGRASPRPGVWIKNEGRLTVPAARAAP